jgi:hypothetical protein
MRAFVRAVVIESGEIIVSNVSDGRRLRGGFHWLVPARSGWMTGRRPDVQTALARLHLPSSRRYQARVRQIAVPGQ